MKFKDGFSLEDVCGEKVLSASGLEYLNFNKLIHLNASAAFLWEKFEGIDFTAEDMAAALVEEYGIEKERAAADAGALIEKFASIGVIG